MFQLRSHLATFHDEIDSVKIDVLSILKQVLVINLQKLKPDSAELLRSQVITQQAINLPRFTPQISPTQMGW